MQVVDAAGVLKGNVSITEVGAGEYDAMLTFRDDLDAGHYTGMFQILVCGDGACTRRYTTKSLPYDVTVTNPVPVLAAINANRAAAGCGDFSLHVIGANFVRASTVNWNGSPRPTQFVSPTLLSVQIGAADISIAGTATVTAQSPAIGGGTTSGATFVIDAAVLAESESVTLFGDPQRTARVATSCPVSKPTEPLWSLPEALSQPPVIAGGRAFLGGQSTFGAYDLASGATAWSRTMDPPQTTYADGRLYTVDRRDFGMEWLSALDATTGVSIWSVPIASGSAGPPSVAQGRVFVRLYSGVYQAVAYSAIDGTTLWTASDADAFGSAGSITLTDSAVVFCKTTALRPDTGAVLWSNSVGSCFSGISVPVLAGGLLYLPVYNPHTAGTYTTVVDPATGMSLYDVPASEPPLIGSKIGVFMVNGTLTGRDLATNTVIWSKGFTKRA